MQSTCMMAVTLADQEARQAVGTTAEASATAAPQCSGHSCCSSSTQRGWHNWNSWCCRASEAEPNPWAVLAALGDLGVNCRFGGNLLMGVTACCCVPLGLRFADVVEIWGSCSTQLCCVV
jgi:hypothetical protein